MNERRLNSPIDHYIQGDILRQLYKSNGPMSFTDLKPDGMENSLFMYHMNKLINRKIVEKIDSGGFLLTKRGARWVNLVDETTLQPTLNPRVIINFLAVDGKDILLVRRKGVPADHLNEFLLPGGLLMYGENLQASTGLLVEKRFGEKLPTKFLGTQEVIHRLDDEYSHHVLIMLQEIRLLRNHEFIDDDRYEYVWMPTTEAAKSPGSSPFLGAIVERLQKKTIKNFESFVFSS